MEIVLSAVPPWFPNQPYLSVPLLTGILRAAGHQVKQFDLNLQFYENMFDAGSLEAYLNRYLPADALLPPSRHELWASRHEVMDSLKDALSIIRGPDFYDPAKLREAAETLEIGLRLASLPFPDVTLSLGDCKYSFDAFEPAEVARFIGDEARNPFLHYFRAEHFTEICNAAPQLYGISVTTHEQLIPALTLCLLLREHCPEVRIVLGGDIIGRVEAALVATPALWNLADYLVCGYGEEAIRLLPQAMEGNVAWSAVPNLVYHGPEGTVRTARKKTVDMQRLPYPDFDGFSLDRYLSPVSVLPVELSKGCYWDRCAFCEVVGQGYESKGGARIAQEIEFLQKKYGTRHFTICDSAAPPAHLMYMGALLKEREVEVYWRTMLRAEEYITAERARHLYAAGCRMVMVGFESGSDAVLGRMDKGGAAAISETVLANLAEAGVWVHGYFLFGFPGETKADVNLTLDMIKRNSHYLRSLGVNLFILAKDSPAARSIDLVQVTDALKPLQIHQPRFAAAGPSPVDDNELRRLIAEELRGLSQQRAAAQLHLTWAFLHAHHSPALQCANAY